MRRGGGEEGTRGQGDKGRTGEQDNWKTRQRDDRKRKQFFTECYDYNSLQNFMITTCNHPPMIITDYLWEANL